MRKTNAKKDNAWVRNDLYSLEPITEMSQDFFAVSKTPSYKFLKMGIEKAPPGMVMGLYGEYGAGKTSILNLIQRDLNAEDYKMIVFDSWKYEVAGNLAAPLLAMLVREAEGKDPKVNEEIKKKAKRILKVIVATTAGMVLRSSMGGSLDSIQKTFELIEATEWHDEVEQAGKDFGSLISTLSCGGRKKVVLALDELDRCCPENVLALLASIRAFFARRSENALFIVSIFDEAVKARIESVHGSVYGNGDLFLDKVIDERIMLSSDVHAGVEILVQKINDPEQILQKAIIDMNGNCFKVSRKLQNKRRCLQAINRVIRYDEFNRAIGKREFFLPFQLLSICISVGWEEFLRWALVADEDLVRKWYQFVFEAGTNTKAGSGEYGKLGWDEGGMRESVVDGDLVCLLRKNVLNEGKMMLLLVEMSNLRIVGVV